MRLTARTMLIRATCYESGDNTDGKAWLLENERHPPGNYISEAEKLNVEWLAATATIYTDIESLDSSSYTLDCTKLAIATAQLVSNSMDRTMSRHLRWKHINLKNYYVYIYSVSE